MGRIVGAVTARVSGAGFGPRIRVRPAPVGMIAESLEQGCWLEWRTGVGLPQWMVPGSPSRRGRCAHSAYGVPDMVDNLDRQTRSRVMGAIRSKDTLPEIAIRKALHGQGFRYRTHVSALPGRPDIALRRYRAVVFVHGCFWHGHDCGLFRAPTTRPAFWRDKIERNRERDAEAQESLRAGGWRCLTVWECALRGPERREFGTLVDEIAGWLTSEVGAAEVRGTGWTISDDTPDRDTGSERAGTRTSPG